MSSVRRFHRIIGLTLLVPFFGWIATALVFYVKPGYQEAYEYLHFKTYPLKQVMILPAHPEWREVRCIRTILGNHLCIRTDSTWRQIDPVTFEPRPLPDGPELTSLLHDAFSVRPERYGTVISIEGTTIRTSTGVRVTVDWDGMKLSQRGRDTDLIDWTYRIHYLQWTGIDAIDKILGPVGLLLVFILSVLGLRLAFRSSTDNKTFGSLEP